MGKADAGHGLGQDLGAGAHDGDGRHRAGQYERRDHGGLVVLGINTSCAQHRGVEGHGRISVDQAGDHTVLVDELGAEHDLRHVHGILRPTRFRHRTHEGFIRQFEVAVHHIEVSFVHWDIDRLTDGAAGMMQRRTEIRQTDKVLKVGKCGVTPALVKIMHKRGAIGRHQDTMVAPNAYAALRVACELRVFVRCAGIDDRPAHAFREANPFPVDLGTRLFEAGQGVGIIAKINTGLREKRFGVGFDQLKQLFAGEFVGRYPAGDVGNACSGGTRAFGAFRRACTASCSTSFLTHDWIPV